MAEHKEYKERPAHVVSAYMAKIRGHGSKIELRLGAAMWKRGLRYRKHYPVVGKPDFAFPKSKIAIFCDSHFWHGHRWEEDGKEALRKNRPFWINKIEANIARDARVNEELAQSGWTVLRFWEHEILGKPEDCIERVLRAVSPLHSNLGSKFS